MKKILFILVTLHGLSLFAQKDSLRVGDAYLEDQLYVGVTYNQLYNQPNNVTGSGFSYGFNAGYIRDISLVKSGRLALGIGLGYAFDSFKHGFRITQLAANTISVAVDPTLTATHPLTIHAIEFPFEFRWRTSSPNKYRFWRVYTGFKVTYNLKHTITFTENNITRQYTNIDRFNKLQYGLTIAAGYSAFNFNFYYGLTPFFKDASIGTSPIGTKTIKMGLIFYIL
ncbi:MAG: PorT family protein [Flavobacteriaceae bacterium]|nr:PorT family protein [Flavobacteriaceae bacterium]